MQRTITGFHRDAIGDWVAELECGHGQHVRHDPPWQVRPWVLDETSRRQHIGQSLDCRLCESDPGAFEDAKLRGLCDEGAREVS